jgi:hypothetical protein
MTQIAITVFLFVEYLPEDSQKTAKHVGLPRLYIIVSNYSVVVGIYMMTCLTVWNINKFKFVCVCFTGCMNVTYDPDDFTFTIILGINDRVLYKNTMSGK